MVSSIDEDPLNQSATTGTEQEERIAELPNDFSTSHIGLDDFKILKVIGRGSYAKVFQVEHRQTGRIYAMKVIKKETILEEDVSQLGFLCLCWLYAYSYIL